MPPEVSMTELHAFVLERSHEVPMPRRAVLLRTLAEVIGSADEARELRSMAVELERVERRQKKLLLRFKERRA